MVNQYNCNFNVLGKVVIQIQMNIAVAIDIHNESAKLFYYQSDSCPEKKDPHRTPMK